MHKTSISSLVRSRQLSPHRIRSLSLILLMAALGAAAHAFDSPAANGRPIPPAAVSTGASASSAELNTAPLQRVNGREADSAAAQISQSSVTRPRLDAQAVLVMEQDTGKVLLRKQAGSVRSIASLTKLMTGIVLLDSKLSLRKRITITRADVDRLKGSSSRLKVGTRLTRRKALRLALMSSENRAAHALARTYPGGEHRFVAAMNRKARALGMRRTRFVEPTGLSQQNRSTAQDLALLAKAAHQRPLLRQYTTSHGAVVPSRQGVIFYRNTNQLVRERRWDIGLQKTGYIREAGYCLLMQTRVAGRRLIMVFLDSVGTAARIADARKVEAWLRSSGTVNPVALADEDDMAGRPSH